MTDYRTLLGKAIQQHPYPMDAADFLATRIPWLCPDCKGSGRRPCDCHEPYDAECGTIPCTHPNAPTIADLLQKGAWYDNLKRQYDQAVLALMDAESRLAALRGEGQ